MRFPTIQWPTAAVAIAFIAAMTTVYVVDEESRATLLLGLGTLGTIVGAVMRAALSHEPPKDGES